MRRNAAVVLAFLLVGRLGIWAATDIPEGVVKLLQKRCAVCHKGNNPPRGLNFEPANIAAVLDAPSKEVPSLKIVDTKSPGTSYLLRKVRREAGIVGRPMPPPKALTAEELQVIETWIGGLK